MNPILRVHFHEQVHMIGQHFHFDELGARFSTDLLNNRLEPGIDTVIEDCPSIFWTPNHVVFTGINHVPIRLVLNFIG
jgi:hypothetical protein